MRLRDCHNFHDFRRLAKRRLPGPIFNYIDGAADDEVTYRRNTASFERCDLVPNVLRGVETVDLSVSIMGQRLAVPFYCSPTALQRLLIDDCTTQRKSGGPLDNAQSQLVFPASSTVPCRGHLKRHHPGLGRRNSA